MQRFDGRDLGLSPHIAVLGSCKLGNFVVTIPMLRLLRKRYPNATIDFWGSEVTKDFEVALCRDTGPLNWRTSWDKNNSDINTLFNAFSNRLQLAGPLELLINCDGFNPFTQTLACLFRPKFLSGGGLRSDGRGLLEWGKLPNQMFLADDDWDSPEFLSRYKDLFNSNYIAELLCRMVFLEPTSADLVNIDLPWEEPNFITPEILIHCTTARSAKIWPFEKWSKVLMYCKSKNHQVGLIGAPPKEQAQNYHSDGGEDDLLQEFPSTLIDLRGKTNLIQLAGACRRTKAMISVDAGPMHVSAGVGTNTLAIVGNDSNGDGVSPVRLWLPRGHAFTRTTSDFSTDFFARNHYRNDDQNLALQCMNGVSATQVIAWIKQTVT
jgi:ADP-heptose:LPS heptosyltransferase